MGSVTMMLLINSHPGTRDEAWAHERCGLGIETHIKLESIKDYILGEGRLGKKSACLYR